MHSTKVILTFLLLASTLSVEAKQLQPDPKRVKQIQQVLDAHGYEPGKTWTQTRATLEQIALEHGWQHKYVPDARVLILLELGNEHSDPDILTWPPATQLFAKPKGNK